ALGLYWVYFVVEWRSHSREARQLGGVLLLCGLAVLINPYGLRFITAMIVAWSLPRDTISEWGNVFQLDVPFYGLLYTGMLLLWLGIALYQWLKAPRRFPLVMLLLAGTGVYGWMHHKLAPLFLIAVLSLGSDLQPFRHALRFGQSDCWLARLRPLKFVY